MRGDRDEGRGHEHDALSRGALLRRGLGAGAGLSAFGVGGEALAALRQRDAATVTPGKLSVWLAGFGATAKTGTPLRKWYDAQVQRFEQAYPGSTVTTTLQS